MNIFLIILLIILLIPFILILLPVTLYIEKNQGKNLYLKVNYLFVKWDNKSKPKKKYDNKKAASKTTTEKKSFCEKASYYLKLFLIILKQLKYILSHTKIKKLNLKFLCAEGDAALTALCYGAVCGGVYPLLSFIESIAKVDDGAFILDIKCDYNKQKSEYAFNIKIRLSVVFAIIGGLKFYLNFKKLESKD